jgi:alpha-1,2-mannosyltransferase
MRKIIMSLSAATLGAYGALLLTHISRGLLNPADLHVYWTAGQVVLHARPEYNPALAAPLYDWPGHGLKFTYPPFAAVVFALLALPPRGVLIWLWLAINILALVATILVTLGALGYRASAARLGGALLLAAGLFWTEPAQRTLYLGQIEIVLMALIMWDLCQPERRWWRGAGVGIAAGIKLVPLIFIAYLLLTRRFREACVAAGTFVATVLVGVIVLPADSRAWWLNGLFLKSSREGFTGWEGNQSLQGLITRLSGSIAAGQPVWMGVALVVLIGGLACAVALQRAGHELLGLLTCALTGLLVSPISWDHHWVWIVPGVTVLVCYGLRARGALRWAWITCGVLIAGLFGAWPVGGFVEGLIWAPPMTSSASLQRFGDGPQFAEYHWHGFELLIGNLYVLTGLAVLLTATVLLVVRWRVARRRHQAADARAAPPLATRPVSP